MAILDPNVRVGAESSRGRRIAGRASGLVAVALLFLAACMMGGGAKEKRFAFSHAAHGANLSLACTDCHASAEHAEDPGMPRAAQCGICHAELDAAKPEDRKVASLFGPDGFLAAHTRRQSDEIVFSHQNHAVRQAACQDCHADVASDEGTLQAGDDARMSMDRCIDCHVASTGPALADCAACHVEIRADVAPPDHRADWKRFHGSVVRARSDLRSDQCAICHKPSECVDCHSVELPLNHTNYWRRRAHGLTASMDRASCATCHQEDSCLRCHQEVKPLSHTGGWGEPQDRHCLFCHEPVRSTTCGVCHPSTPSHATATALPPDHNPGMNCRMCHGNGQPLPHVDNGQSCVTCHR